MFAAHIARTQYPTSITHWIVGTVQWQLRLNNRSSIVPILLLRCKISAQTYLVLPYKGRGGKIAQWLACTCVSNPTIDGWRQPWSGYFDNQFILNLRLSTRPASAAGWCNTGRAMCYHVSVIVHVKDPPTICERGIVSR